MLAIIKNCPLHFNQSAVLHVAFFKPFFIMSLVKKAANQSVLVNLTPTAPGGSIKLHAEMHSEILKGNLIVHSTHAICEDTLANQYKDH